MSAQEPSDRDLVAAVNAGRAEAFEALYARYRDWVHGLAWRMTGDREQALDVLQETFLYLLKKFPGLRLTARMTTLLYPVVKNLSIAARRRNQRYVHDSEFLEALAARSQGPDLGDLAAVLAVLGEAQREVVLMRFVDGFSLSEIARLLGVPEGTVKSRLYNGLNTLREDPGTRRYFGR